jgi:hypothetical protein
MRISIQADNKSQANKIEAALRSKNVQVQLVNLLPKDNYSSNYITTHVLVEGNTHDIFDVLGKLFRLKEQEEGVEEIVVQESEIILKEFVGL